MPRLVRGIQRPSGSALAEDGSTMDPPDKPGDDEDSKASRNLPGQII